MNKTIKTVLCGIGSSWCVLGGYRNVQYNNFEKEKKKNRVLNNLNDFKNQYNTKNLEGSYYNSRLQELQKDYDEVSKPNLYVDQSVNFIGGVFIYANPFFSPFTIEAELYRLEVNLRGLEDEKKSNRYYKVIF